jgi:hypothetical protein
VKAQVVDKGMTADFCRVLTGVRRTDICGANQLQARGGGQEPGGINTRVIGDALDIE